MGGRLEQIRRLEQIGESYEGGEEEKVDWGCFEEGELQSPRSRWMRNGRWRFLRKHTPNNIYQCRVRKTVGGTRSLPPLAVKEEVSNGDSQFHTNPESFLPCFSDNAKGFLRSLSIRVGIKSMLAREDDDWVETTARTPSQSRRAENPRDFPSQMDSEPDDAMTAYWQMNRYSKQS